MALTNVGRNDFAADIIGGAITEFDNANAHIGVGDGTGVFAKAQTDLQGASKFRQPMVATYPQIATNVLTFRAVYATGDANFAWEEWGVFNAVAGGTMLNRKVESLGTKASSQSWQFTVTLTVDNP
ncbi:hypothetical protein LCGC14_0810770 [marine sediment metagenome]|uniref:Uncharacterized protein n=1 Tax=marine sediment metagenome TaxID=412755 RepID=A0A0F9SU57_9ZZZZ